MRLRLLIIALLLPLSLSAQFQSSSWKELEDSETVTAMKSHVEFFASPVREGRAAGSEGETETALYLYDKFSEYGLQLLVGENGDLFGISREGGDTLQSRNMVAAVQGRDPELYDHYIVIAARMDNKPVNEMTVDGQINKQVFRGANGNASGLSMLLELAKKISTHSSLFRRSVIFAGFGASEQGSMGSWYFLNRSFADLGTIDAMINLDMLGCGSKMYAYTSSNQDMNVLLKSMETSLQPILPVLTAAEPYPSDHRSFYAANIPSVYFTTGQYAEYGTVRDVPEILDYELMERELEYIFNFAKELAGKESAPSFNISQAKERTAGDKVWSYVDCDTKPSFMRRSDPKYFIQTWVYQYLRYPSYALENGIQGRVQVQFVIEKDGSVSDIRILKSADESFSREVERVLKASPKWKPGLVGGQPVRSSITIPVDFMLQKKGKIGLKK